MRLPILRSLLSYRQPTIRFTHRSFAMSTTTVPNPYGPIETQMRQKLKDKFNPVQLEISNDSSAHSHHSAMRAAGGGSGETHFTVTLTSALFEGQKTIQRHRSVYVCLHEELKKQGGIHALALTTKTPDEVDLNVPVNQEA